MGGTQLTKNTHAITKDMEIQDRSNSEQELFTCTQTTRNMNLPSPETEPTDQGSGKVNSLMVGTGRAQHARSMRE